MPKLTIGEIVKGLDAFYAEPANANIAIRTALLLLSAKVDGLSGTDLQWLTEMARKGTLTTAK